MDFLLDILPKYDMITKSCSGRKLHMGEFPSGQRGQTVNLLLIASVVRIHLPPPIKTHQLCWWVFIGGGRFVDSNPLESNMPVACWPDCQNSLAEFAASAAKRIRSFSAGACTWQKIHLRLQVWNLFAYGEQIMRAADCKNWRKSPKGFSDKLSNMPVACWQNQCKHWFSPYRFPSESGQSNPPSPYCATSFAGGSFAGGGRFVDSNPLKSNMPVACWQNQCKHWFSDTFHTERSGSPASGKRVNKRICPWQRYLFL